MNIDYSQLITADDKAQQAAAAAREAWKTRRAEAVRGIKVTTASGRVFDGDEISQARMARAILGLQEAGEGATVTWVLADNTPVAVTAAELYEALHLAGAEQARLWVASHE